MLRHIPKIQFCILLIVCLISGIDVLAQAPASVSIEGNSLYKHGTNSGGITAEENIDSVSVGTTTKYYILPDAAVNPGFDHAVSLFANVNSSFIWSVPVALAAGQDDPVPAYPAAPHYKQVSWTSVGTGNIDVTERSSDLCDGNTVSTAVEVISVPDVTAVSVTNVSCTTTPVSVTCPNASLTITSVVNGNKGFKVSYSLSGPAGFTAVNNSDISVTNSGVLNLSGITLDRAGEYTLTITKITDRIANKCGLSAINENESATFYVTIRPITGSSMHVPNDAGW